VTKIKLSGEGEVSAEKVDKVEGNPSSTQENANAEDDEEVQRHLREKDLDRLRMMPFARRRDVAQMDVMGEYGSKVGRTELCGAHKRSTSWSSIYCTIARRTQRVSRSCGVNDVCSSRSASRHFLELVGQYEQ
jgi:hypothetical protein